ncbi:hypothetical protein B0A53_06510 [Rhodotorula sp. CCFEE 5036]|nr:hypothetical protein B0A53_06510 [Rhodotorula sp. CCFEE 5036]
MKLVTYPAIAVIFIDKGATQALVALAFALSYTLAPYTRLHRHRTGTDLTVNPSAYLTERARRPVPAPRFRTDSPPSSPTERADTSAADDSASDFSDSSDTPTAPAACRLAVPAAIVPTPPQCRRTIMNTATASLIALAATRQLGKAPVLLDCSPSGLKDFLRAARSYFRKQKDFEDVDKINTLGEGLLHFVELKSWYNSNEDRLEAMKYDDFVAELNKKTLPRNYVWDAKAFIRSSLQGSINYNAWSDDMRAEHLALGEQVMSTREFVEHLLFNMDAEVSVVLRRGTSLKGTGLLDEETAALAVTTTTAPQIYKTVVDYDKFNDEARLEWSKIAVRRESNAMQLRALAKKSSSKSQPATHHAPSRNTGAAAQTARPNAAAGDGPRLPTLTAREKADLDEHEGCYKCRRTNAGHRSNACPNGFPPAEFVIKIPSGWVATPRPPFVPAATTTTAPNAPAARAGIRALRIEDSDSDEEVYLGFDSSDSDLDG